MSRLRGQGGRTDAAERWSQMSREKKDVATGLVNMEDVGDADDVATGGMESTAALERVREWG